MERTRAARGPRTGDSTLPPVHPVQVLRRAALWVFLAALVVATAAGAGPVGSTARWVAGAGALVVAGGVAGAVVGDRGRWRR